MSPLMLPLLLPPALQEEHEAAAKQRNNKHASVSCQAPGC